MTTLNKTPIHEEGLQLKLNRFIAFRRAYPVFQISLQKLIASKRRNFMIALILLFPLLGNVIGIILRRSPDGEITFLHHLEDFFYFYFNALVGVIIFLFLAVSLTSEELNDKTVIYYLHSPIHRMDILIYKYLAFIVFSLSIFLPIIISFYFVFAQFIDPNLMFEHVNLLLAGITITIFSIFLYGTVFFFIALTIPQHPLITGLGISLVDLFLQNSFFEGLLGAYSVSYHIKAIASDLLKVDGRNNGILANFTTVMKITDSYLVIIFFIVLFGLLAIYQFNRREVL